jgi:hypothetical protein
MATTTTTILRRLAPEVEPVNPHTVQVVVGPTIFGSAGCWRTLETWRVGATHPITTTCSRLARWIIHNGTIPEHNPLFCGQHALAHLKETGRL